MIDINQNLLFWVIIMCVEAWAIKAPDGLRIDTLTFSYNSCVHQFVDGDIGSWDRYHDEQGYRCIRVSVKEIPE